jgi:hypothetical protein
MYRRSIFVLLAVLLFSSYSNAQTIREKIDMHAKDPKTKENAAKADVYIVDKKLISSNKYDSCKARKVRKGESRRARKNGSL